MFNRIAAMTAITLGMTISIFGQNTTLKGKEAQLDDPTFTGIYRRQFFERLIDREQLDGPCFGHGGGLVE